MPLQQQLLQMETQELTGTWIMLHIVNPALALLHTQASPFRL